MSRALELNFIQLPTRLMGELHSLFCASGSSFETTAWACQVDQTFEVKGVGSVISGTVVAGEICLGQRLMMGPTDEGGFATIVVSCIQRAQVQSMSQL